MDASNPTSVVQNQVGFAPQLAKYGEGVLGNAELQVGKQYQSYADWAQQHNLLSADQVAKFSKLQNTAFQGAENLNQDPYSQQAAAGLAGLAQQAGTARYNPNQFNAQQVSNPALQNYQMGPAQQVDTQSFTGRGTANQYMNPYMQNVVDIQKREAQRQAGIQGTQQQAQATQAGAFGGSRDAIMRAERERNLGTQMNDIQAQGSQAAYQQAQQQFNQEQAARLQAQQANQQAGLTVGSQNLNAKLQTQQLGSGQNMQAQLANQQQNLAAQQAAEQSKQFGANYGLQGTQMGLQGYSALGSQGQNLYGQTTNNLGIQNQMGTQQQQQAQNLLNVGYQNYINEQNDPYKKIGFMSDIVRGSPMSGLGSNVYQAQPSTLNQVAGLGTAAAGLYGAYNKATGSAKGGTIKSKKPAGLPALLVHSMA
jgi:hypothetical protein